MIGIEAINVDPGRLSFAIADLCRARGLDAENFCGRLRCHERSVVGPFEDVVTLAVNAANELMTDDVRQAVRLLIVATESSVDQEKPVSTWVHSLLGLRADCRNFEIKHACYGGTAALQMAMAWIASGIDPGGKALIVCADHALIGLGRGQEPVLGSGAVAMLVSSEPRLVAFELGRNGVFAHEVADVFRPAPGVETGDADESLTSYLDAVEAAYDAYRLRVGEPIDFASYFSANVYHAPFGGLAERAHLRLARRELGLSRREAEADFARRSLPSLTYNRRTGALYGGAVFAGLLGLIDAVPDLRAGDRISVYSYGSGSCAEFYSALVQPEARATAAAAKAAAKLDSRRCLSLEEYESCERHLNSSLAARSWRPQRDLIAGLFEEQYAGRRRLTLAAIDDYYRRYEWS